MALLKYFKRLETPVINVNEECCHLDTAHSDEKKKKRGEYNKYSDEAKLKIGKYACEHGVMKAVRHFKEKNVKESTVRDWKKIYERVLKEKCAIAEPGDEVTVLSLPCKPRGRPTLLGENLDKDLQQLVLELRSRGSPISTSVVLGLGRGLLLKHNKRMLVEFGGSIQLNKEWARSVFRRMGFTKRRANSKSKVLPDHFSNLKRQFLREVEAVTKIEDIPNNLIINWDQTALKLVPSGSWTMERKGTKRVDLSGIDDKRQITAVLSGTLTGDFLPLQLIFKGTTARSLPSISFPDSWHITYTENHWSNNSTMIAYISHIIIPYVEKKRAELKLGPTHPALVLFDVFKGQCQENVYKLLEENNIYFVLIPANCTDKLQPLDLSVNKPVKDFMKRKFQEWYGDIVCEQLRQNSVEPVDMRLSVMKPLIGQWSIDMYKHFLANPSILTKITYLALLFHWILHFSHTHLVI